MRWLSVVGALAIALVLQTTLTRFLVLGTAPLDLVLLVIVFVALQAGPTVGLVAGCLAGLAQDALGSGAFGRMAAGIIGIGGLSKTVVGYLVGLVGLQFIVQGPLQRFVVFFAATIAHEFMFMGLYELFGLRRFGWPIAAVGARAVANAAVGIVVFQIIELLPGMVERRAAARHRVRAPRQLD